MADLEDVLATLLAVAASAIYPAGTGQPSITGQPTRLRIGWPVSEELRAEAEKGITNVTIFADDSERNVTDVISAPWEALPAVPLTLTTAQAAPDAVSFGGTTAAGQLAMIVSRVKAWGYAVQAGDTPASIATALATLIGPDHAAASAGPVLTVPGLRVACRLGQAAGALREIGRQARQIRISVWCADPDGRSAAAAPIDQKLRGLTRLALPDGSKAHLTYIGSPLSDAAGKALIYRRDLLQRVEYPTVASLQASPVLAPVTTIGPLDNPAAPPTTTLVS